VLSAHHLTRRFGTRVAVDEVSFDLTPGEIFALLGPNGAGKTTTLRLLAGLIAPSSGSVLIDGEALTGQTASRLRERIGFLPEAAGLWDHLSVWQNLRIYARLYRVPSPDRAVERALSLFGVLDRRDDIAAQLSKGLKQRVALARTLVHDPATVLLDEPTAGLDPESARDVRELILRLRAEGRTVLLCTHNLDEVERVADRVAVLRSRLVAIGTPGELGRSLFAPRLIVRLAGTADRYGALLRARGLDDVAVSGTSVSVPLSGASMDVPQIVRMLVESGADIESVEQEHPSLEEVYLRLLHPTGGAR
jgi:ABC-2 type transport system ATP-binding protein